MFTSGLVWSEIWDIPTDPIWKVNCNVSPVVISQDEIVEKGHLLAGMLSLCSHHLEFSSLNFSQLQSSFHTTPSPVKLREGEREGRQDILHLYSWSSGEGGGRWWRRAISSSQLKCIGCSDSASNNWWENISIRQTWAGQAGAGTCVGCPGLILASQMSPISSDLASTAQLGSS